jgi:hypothetical protein
MAEDWCVDDPVIAHTEILWRAVHPTQVTVDHITGSFRPKSGAFRDANHRLSIDVSSQTVIADTCGRNPGKFIAQFTVKEVRDLGKKVTQSVEREPNNPAHGIVCPKLSGAEARIIANRENAWVHPPPPGFVPPTNGS